MNLKINKRPMVLGLALIVLTTFFYCKPGSEDTLILPLVRDASAGTDVVDNGDGTVKVISQNLTWAKCGQTALDGSNAYNDGGASDACNKAALFSFEYCGAQDNTCNGDTNIGILDGTDASQSYDSCNNLTLGGRSWRVPTRVELGLFYYGVIVDNGTMFPGRGTTPYWATNSWTTTNAYNFTLGGLSPGVSGSDVKDATHFLHCVSDGT